MAIAITGRDATTGTYRSTGSEIKRKMGLMVRPLNSAKDRLLLRVAFVAMFTRPLTKRWKLTTVRFKASKKIKIKIKSPLVLVSLKHSVNSSGGRH